VVGAIGEDSSSTGIDSTPNESAAIAGAAYVFTRSAGVWSQQAYLKPAAVGTTQAGDNFGWSVGVSADFIVVGAYLEDSSSLGVNSTPNEGAADSGAAYVFALPASGTGGGSKAVMTSPAPGATLSGASVTFTWSVALGASAYWLDVGSAQGQSNIFGQNVGVATSQTVNGIPTDGSTVYVRLWTLAGGAWQSNDYTYSEWRKHQGIDASGARRGIGRRQRHIHVERCVRRVGLLAGCGIGARPGKHLRAERWCGNQPDRERNSY
jgi:hypothetical protein